MAFKQSLESLRIRTLPKRFVLLSQEMRHGNSLISCQRFSSMSPLSKIPSPFFSSEICFTLEICSLTAFSTLSILTASAYFSFFKLSFKLKERFPEISRDLEKWLSKFWRLPELDRGERYLQQ